jgi:hypothetical protein
VRERVVLWRDLESWRLCDTGTDSRAAEMACGSVAPGLAFFADNHPAGSGGTLAARVLDKDKATAGGLRVARAGGLRGRGAKLQLRVAGRDPEGRKGPVQGAVWADGWWPSRGGEGRGTSCRMRRFGFSARNARVTSQSAGGGDAGESACDCILGFWVVPALLAACDHLNFLC